MMLYQQSGKALFRVSASEVESERKRFREEWERTVAHFHNVFADIPEEEVIRDFEEALAEVRRERIETANIHK